MPSLLTIPYEIRGAILETVLLSSRPAPPDVATAAEHRLEPSSYDGSQYPPHSRFERTDYVSNAYPLLLVNQQLSAETKSAVSRLTLTGLSYKLEVMFVEEHEFWPTWLCIPSPAEHIDRVDVTLRIFETTRESSDPSIHAGGDGSLPHILLHFYFLLEHFLTHGPFYPGHGKTSKCNKNRNISVKTVNLNFLAEDAHLPPSTEEQLSSPRWWQPQRSMYLGRKGQQDDSEPPKYIIRPEWLAETLAHYFQNLISMGYHTAAYGGIVHERVGSVRFNVDGELLWEFDIGAQLASLSFAPDAGHTRYTTQTFGRVAGEDRLRTFWSWKERTVRRRKERGLPVPDPVVMVSPQELLRLQKPIQPE